MSYTIDEIKFGGKYHPFFWGDLNPNATISNGIANCTTFTYGDCLRDGWEVVSRIVNANQWHTVTNGEVLNFDINLVEVGDVLEWVNGCHVAKVDRIENGKIYLNCSWYTGVHGVAIYNGSWDTRPFSSLQELSDFMFTNYPTRTYHNWTLEQECNGVGGQPQYIIKKPHIIEADGEDKSVDQILVKTSEQNVRTQPNGAIIGIAQSGYYDVYDKVADSKYIWYKIHDGYFIAGVDGRVEFIEGEDDIARLKKENAELKERLRQINKLSEV